MVRRKPKWKFSVIFTILLLSVLTKSLPVHRSAPTFTIVDTSFVDLPDLIIADDVVSVASNSDTITTESEPITTEQTPTTTEEIATTESNSNETNSTEVSETNSISEVYIFNATRNTLLRQNIRPGQEARQYSIALSINGGSFTGRAVIQVRLTDATREDPILFHFADLSITSVRTGIFTDVNALDAAYDVADDILEIEPVQDAANFIVVVEYTGQLGLSSGLFQGEFNGVNYLAMNLHPTNARRVFPCMDELTEATTISFTFDNIPYNNIFMNSLAEDNNPLQFRPLQGPPFMWGMVAHNFNNINNPTTNVHLYARPGVTNQEAQAAVAINYIFNALEEWTDKPYTGIVVDQNGRMHIMALPDVSKDWYALSTVCLWEPYLLMERIHSVKQRKESFVEIAEALSRQWFGYVLYPENYRFQWVIQGLVTYSAYEIIREFQDNPVGIDETLLDINTIFVTDVIQESLYRDAYGIAQPLEAGEDLFEEDEIRDHINGLQLLKYKSPAIMWMLKLVLGDENEDFIRSAARILVNSWSLDTVNTLFFYDAIKSEWMANNNGMIDDIEDFIEPWVEGNGYPIIHIGLRQGGVLITQERFGYTTTTQQNFMVPLTYTTSINPNFDNIRPTQMMDGTTTLNMVLDEEDWVLFNIQGQGYYRVNYDSDLWERIIEALEDPERREQIHPLNRATLVDDALNLARAGKLDYEIAFRVVLTMENEVEYAVWKAFVRNMNFLRKRLVAFVDDDDDLDQDIYLRMVRRTVGRVENELGFYPEISATEPAMEALTRGLVMDHACRANYQPCIAAAIDWFYDPNNNDVVNPNIPHEIRPAVYCTMVREGDDQVISALYDRLEIEPVMYERVVILESLACSNDANFIGTLLEETLATNSPYSVEERSRIFNAVAEASYANANIAMNFIARRTADMIRMYGGPEKLEDIIYKLAENLADNGLSTDFSIWVNSNNNDLGQSQLTADRAQELVLENTVWDTTHLQNVYDWIDENDAPTMVVSLLLMSVSLFVAVFNH